MPARMPVGQRSVNEPRNVFLPVRRITRLQGSLPMTELRNRVVQVRRFGGPDELEVVEAPLPTAGRGEVRVRVLASGIEYTDVVIRRHVYPQTMHRRPPFVMGYDLRSEERRVGKECRSRRRGNREKRKTRR